MALGGKPMLAYTVEACLESKCFQRVHVSTDSKVYATIAREYGADVPFLRDYKYSTDQASTEDVVRFVLDEYDKRGEHYDTFAIMQPTSPLRTADDIKKSFELMKEKQADSVIGICKMEHSPIWSNILPENGSMNGFLDVTQNLNRQSFSQYYRINGAMYLVKREIYTQHTAMYGPNSYAYVMPKSRSIDIDDEVDYRVAQAMLESRK